MLSGLQHPFRSNPSSSGGSPGTNYASGGPEYDSFCLDSLWAFHTYSIFECVNLRQLGVFYIVLIIVIISYRLTFRSILELYRKSGENVRKVVLVGSHENMQELYHSMTDDPTSGYRVLGYFVRFSVRPLSYEHSLFGTAV